MSDKDKITEIINTAVDYFLKNGDKIDYDTVNAVFRGKTIDCDITTASLLLAITVIVHNIPRRNKETGIWELRPYEECYNGSITFWKSNIQEKFMVKITNNKPMVDLVSGRILPKLTFYNTNNIYLESGFGEGVPDLIDEYGVTYEVKSNYRKNGSVSSLHNANRLIDFDGTHVVIYSVFNNIPDFRASLYRFPTIIEESDLKYYHALDDETLNLIKSGELISEVEKYIENKNIFKTN